MPKRAIILGQGVQRLAAIRQATVAGGFMFVCCVGARPLRPIRGGRRTRADASLPRQHPRADRGGRRHDADIVKCTVYVTDRAYWQPMNEVYFKNFTDDPPHRVSCIVSGLGAPECLVEIDATAHLGKD